MTLISINSSIRSTYLLIWNFFSFCFSRLCQHFYFPSAFFYHFLLFHFGHFFSSSSLVFFKESHEYKGWYRFCLFHRVSYTANVCHRKTLSSLWRLEKILKPSLNLVSTMCVLYTLWKWVKFQFMHEECFLFLNIKTFPK